jgi:hypothetical protein
MSEDKAPIEVAGTPASDASAPKDPVVVKKEAAAKVIPEPALQQAILSSVLPEDTSTHVNKAVPPPGRVRKGKTKPLSDGDRVPSNWNLQAIEDDRIRGRSSDGNCFEGTRKEFSKFIGS